LKQGVTLNVAAWSKQVALKREMAHPTIVVLLPQ
jgi:hypothetical protein